MHPLFHIKPEDIQGLNDTQARELVARLCRAELRGKQVVESFVTWGGDQRAKDGGVDVRVNINPSVSISGYIPKDLSIFQVKAENFANAKIKGEIAPKGKVRPLFQELQLHQGAYIIVSTKDCLSDTSILSRKTEMQKCLGNQAKKIVLDFYDSRKIADWVEQFPSIVIWVRQQLGKPITGWKPYAPWAYYEDNIESSYLIDEKVKVIVPNQNEGITVTEAISKLRKILSETASVRIVGLSGVGKTRLVQALFDDRVATEQPALIPDTLLYTDLSINPDPLPVAMVEALFSNNSDAIVIIDNCGSDTHNKLTEIVTKTGSRLRLITVEYDIRDDLPESTHVFRLEGASNEVIEELLKRHYPVLSPQDVRNITMFSEGNARVAFALASSSETKGELAKLEDADLFERLFFQKNLKNEELLNCAEVASLLYSFDAEDISENSELTKLASLSDVSVNTFFSNIVEIQGRGLIQERGQWKAVLPHAIANRLAARAVERFHTKHLVDALAYQSTDRVARSFSRRLGFLHECKKAQAIVGEWLKEEGWLGDVTKLNDLGLHIFLNIAPVNQPAAINALQRGIQNNSFVSTENYNRHQFAEVVRSLAYDANNFNQAVEVLIHFALVEPEDHRNNSIRKILKSLFYSHLSGTKASLEQRALIVRNLLLSDDISKQKIGQSLLKSALTATYFTCMYSFDFGALKRDYGWYPKSKDDVQNWYLSFINILLETVNLKADQGKELISLFANAFRGLWTIGLEKELVSAVRQLGHTQYLAEVWLAAHSILLYDKDSLAEESKAALISIEKKLAPQSLEETIRAKVLSQGSYIFDDGQDEEPVRAYERAREVAEQLGKTAAKNVQVLISLLPELLDSQDTDKIWNFGCGVGQQLEQPIEFIKEARSIVKEKGTLSVNLQFLRGLIEGCNRVSPNEVDDFFNIAVTDDIWGLCLPSLQLAVPLNQIGFERLIQSLELGIAPTWQFRYLCGGRATDPLSPQQIASLIHLIKFKPDHGLTIAVDILHMVVFCAIEKTDDYRSELVDICLTFLEEFDWEGFESNRGNTAYHLKEIIEFSLKVMESEKSVSIILSSFFENIRSSNNIFSYHDVDVLKPFFKHYPKITLDLIFTPDADGNYASSLSLVESMAWNNDRSNIFSLIDSDALVEWCNSDPIERYNLAANICPLFENIAPEHENKGVSLSSIAKIIFENADDKKEVLNVFLNRFWPSSWSGSLAEILRSRLPLLDSLNVNGDELLIQEISHAKDLYVKQIARETEREATDDRFRALRFE